MAEVLQHEPHDADVEQPTEDLPPEDDQPIEHVDDGTGDDDGGDDEEGGGEGERVRWVTIASFTNPAEAHVARIKLDSEDIPSVILDENMGVAAWHYSIATGGIKLQVPEPEARRATEA